LTGVVFTKEGIIGTASRREQRKEQTRRRLIEAADRLFRRQGFEATTVEAIADAADVAKGTFFNYFQNKEGVLVAILHARLEEAVAECPSPSEPTVQRIYTMLDRVQEALDPYCRMLPHLLMHTMAPRRPKKPAERRRQPLMSVIRRILEEGEARGEVRPGVSVEIGASLIVTYFFRLAFESCLFPGEDSTQDRLQAGMDILFHGLLSEKADIPS